MHVFTCVNVHSVLVLHEQTCIAATRHVWTVVIFKSNETSGPLSNGKTCTVKWWNPLVVKWGVRSNPLEPPFPPAYGPGSTNFDWSSKTREVPIEILLLLFFLASHWKDVLRQNRGKCKSWQSLRIEPCTGGAEMPPMHTWQPLHFGSEKTPAWGSLLMERIFQSTFKT